MKRFLTISLMLFSVAVFAQDSNTPINPEPLTAEVNVVLEVDEKESPFTFATGVGLHSRYFWRGIKFGTGASIQGYADLSMTNEKETGAFGLGAFTAVNFVGSAFDFGNTTNLYLYYTQDIGENSNVTVFLDDYYFYSEDNADDAFDYGDSTRHFIEARAELVFGKIDGVIGYSIYQGLIPSGEQDAAPYIELGYAVNDDTRLFAGGVTGASALNFQTKAGLTNVGVTQSREIKNIPFEFTLACNPFYRNTDTFSMGRPATASAVNFVVGIVLD